MRPTIRRAQPRPLDKTAPYWAPQVAEARSAIAAARLAPDQEQGCLDDHQALEYMRRVLDQLAGDLAPG